MKVYIVLEKDYSYSDCYYDRNDSRQQVNSVFLDREKAEKACLEKNITWLFDNATYDFKDIICYFNEDVHRPSLLERLKEEDYFLTVDSLWGGDDEIDDFIKTLNRSSYLENHQIDMVKKDITEICECYGIYGYEILEVDVE
mgnify:FL=1